MKFKPWMMFLGLGVGSSPLFATDLGQLVVSNPASGSQTITYEKINGRAIAEGDIVIGSLETLSRQGAVIISKISGGRWSNGVVPFELSEDLPFVNKLAIMQAINTWQKESNLEFVELTSKNRYNYKDYISFVPAAGTECSSEVGMVGGQQKINLAPRCNTMNTVHEIGHAVGLWHEQSRTDRNLYIKIVWENIEEAHKHNFEQHLSDGKDFGEYDYESIMHYSEYAFSKNGQKTIIPLKEGVQIGQREHLSEKDIAAVKAMYPAA